MALLCVKCMVCVRFLLVICGSNAYIIKLFSLLYRRSSLVLPTNNAARYSSS